MTEPTLNSGIVAKGSCEANLTPLAGPGGTGQVKAESTSSQCLLAAFPRWKPWCDFLPIPPGTAKTISPALTPPSIALQL